MSSQIAAEVAAIEQAEFQRLARLVIEGQVSRLVVRHPVDSHCRCRERVAIEAHFFHPPDKGHQVRISVRCPKCGFVEVIVDEASCGPWDFLRYYKARIVHNHEPHPADQQP